MNIKDINTEAAHSAAPIAQPAWLRLLAHGISVVFHPIFIIAYMYLLLAWINPQLFGKPNFAMFIGPDSDHLRFFARIMATMIGLPLLAIALMRGLGMISDISLPDRQERIGPYIVVGLSYIVAFVQVNSLHFIPLHLKIFILGCTIALFAAFLINLFSKISTHAVAMGGMVAMTLMSILSVPYNSEASLYFLPAAFFVAGLVGSARRLLGAHDSTDIYSGYFIGFFAQFIALRFLYQP